jgi:Fe-S-cluster containining protein
LDDLLEQYGKLLDEVDDWFEKCMQAHPDKINCHQGCSCCCRGLFDITLLDAIYLQKGIQLLDDYIKSGILNRSEERLKKISEQFPSYVSPWILNSIPETVWDEIMPEEDETPCVLLSSEGNCLVYRNRPMTCRLNGIPMIDSSGEELFDEWCSLNFQDADPLLLTDLRFAFNDLFTQELLLFHELTRRMLGHPVSEVDTLIPAAALIDINSVTKLLQGDNT